MAQLNLNDEQVISLYDWYASLENRLTAILDVFPLTSPSISLPVKTPRLVSILLEACSIIDSLFRTAFPASAILPSGRNVTRGRANINSFYTILEPAMSLTKTYSLFMAPVPVILHPFEDWSDSSSPTWWTIFNNLKHNRLSKPSDVPLKNTINCLCGLQQIMIKVSEVLALSLRFAWIDPAVYNAEYLVDLLQNPPSSQKFLAYTKLFCTPVHPVGWLKEEDIQPGRFVNGGRLIAYLGRMM